MNLVLFLGGGAPVGLRGYVRVMCAVCAGYVRIGVGFGSEGGLGRSGRAAGQVGGRVGGGRPCGWGVLSFPADRPCVSFPHGLRCVPFPWLSDIGRETMCTYPRAHTLHMPPFARTCCNEGAGARTYLKKSIGGRRIRAHTCAHIPGTYHRLRAHTMSNFVIAGKPCQIPRSL